MKKPVKPEKKIKEAEETFFDEQTKILEILTKNESELRQHRSYSINIRDLEI